jgi:hypothetical protein
MLRREPAANRAFEHAVVVEVFLDNLKHLGRPHQLGPAGKLQHGFINLVRGPREFPL